MLMPSFAQKWIGLSGRIALLLGIGAFSATGGKADATPLGDGQLPTRVPQQSAKNFGEMRIWCEGNRIFLSESGGEVRELPFGDTAEARRLRELLQRDGAVAGEPQVLPHRLILVGGGGNGFAWTPPQQTTNPATGASPASGAGPAKPAGPVQGTASRMPKVSAAPAASPQGATD
jgi:hypothetical protein